MCEAVETRDSRYPGWYCCRDNTFNSGAKRVCRACKQARDEKKTLAVMPRPRKKGRK